MTIQQLDNILQEHGEYLITHFNLRIVCQINDICQSYLNNKNKVDCLMSDNRFRNTLKQMKRMTDKEVEHVKSMSLRQFTREYIELVNTKLIITF